MRRLISLILLLYILVSCESKRLTENSQDVMSEVNDLANRYLELNRFSGVILIADGEEEIFNQAYGYANYEFKQPFSKQTAFKVGAISSIFTIEMVKKLASEGEFDLKDEISTYLPEVKYKCTIQELLENKSGLPTINQALKANPEQAYSTIEMVNLSKRESSTNPGGDLGYNLLGVLIERVSGENYTNAVLDFGLEMNFENTYFKKDSVDEATGYGFNNYGQKGFKLREGIKYEDHIAFSNYGIKTSASDLYKLIKYINLPELRINEVLGTEGFCHTAYKKGDVVIIVLSNRKSDVTEEMTRSILAILSHEEYKLPLLRAPVAVDSKVFPDYNGVYKFNDKMNLYVFSKGDSLMMNMGGMNFMLRAQAKDQFYLENVDAALRFKRDEKGVVTRLTLLDGHMDGKEIPKVIK